MTLRNIALIAFLAVGCAHAPPPPLDFATLDRVRILAVDEAGDEWLYEHCDYHGAAVVFDDAHAYLVAAARHSNFIEPINRYTSSSASTSDGITTTSSTSRHAIVLFACKENPPW